MDTAAHFAIHRRRSRWVPVGYHRCTDTTSIKGGGTGSEVRVGCPTMEFLATVLQRRGEHLVSPGVAAGGPGDIYLGKIGLLPQQGPRKRTNHGTTRYGLDGHRHHHLRDR